MVEHEPGVVLRVEDGMDRRTLVATTYQMRNFYKDLSGGWVDPLQVMNYVQHHTIATEATGAVLDVCCGRGLMLPVLRYYAKGRVTSYVGVDIAPENAKYMTERVSDGKPLAECQGGASLAEYYPFTVEFVESKASQMHQHPALRDRTRLDSIIYTSAIEHMQKDEGEASLAACRALAAPAATLWLTCPNTPEDRDGYDTRYRAHIYEWKLSELRAALGRTGWRVEKTYGVAIGQRKLEEQMRKAGMAHVYEKIRAHVAPQWVSPVLAAIFPGASDEVGLVARPK
jgi:SAM-dependent methyltransferase